MRGSAVERRASQSCSSSRVIASSDAERLVEQQHAACRRAACAGRRRAGACRRRARRRARREPSGRSARTAAGPGRGPRRARRRPVLEREAGVVQRVAPGQQQVALGHQRAAIQLARSIGGARRRTVPRRLLEPARSSSRVDLPQPLGPTMPVTPPPGTCSDDAVQRGQVPEPLGHSRELDTPGGRTRHGLHPFAGMTQIRFAGRRAGAPSQPPRRLPGKRSAGTLRARTLPPYGQNDRRLGTEPLVCDGGMGSLLQTAVPRPLPGGGQPARAGASWRRHLAFIRAGPT